MSAILVTGGAGFIGSNVCRALLAQGHTVRVADNLITGKHENIAPLLDHPRFSFFELDISSPEFAQTFSKGEKIDEIYHLACPTGVPNLTTLAEEMIQTCSLGTLNILGVARAHAAKLLFTSSAEVYGDPEVFPQLETYTGNADPIGPRSAYEEGKRFSEACVVAYVRKYGLNAVIVRIFNTYGPGMSLADTRVIPSFIRSIIEKKPLTIYGDGSQTRSHMYIDDLVRGLALVMAKGTPGEAYNVGSDQPKTILEVARLISAMTKHEAGIESKPHFIHDHKGRQPSVKKVVALGWERVVSLEDGLQKMIDYYIAPAPEPETAPLGAQVAPA